MAVEDGEAKRYEENVIEENSKLIELQDNVNRMKVVLK
jgi:hypothetical protein